MNTDIFVFECERFSALLTAQAAICPPASYRRAELLALADRVDALAGDIWVMHAQIVRSEYATGARAVPTSASPIE